MKLEIAPSSRALKAHILLMLNALVWGATFVMIKAALGDASPLLFNAMRMSVAALVLLALYGRGLASASKAELWMGSAIGIFLWLGYEFQTVGLKITTASKSGFLTGLSVLLVPLFLAVGWKKVPTRWTLAGAGLALCGLYLMTVPSGSGLSGVNRGDVLTIGTAIAFALHIIYLGRAMQRFRFERVATLQTSSAALLMILCIPFDKPVFLAWSPRLIVAVLVTGILATAAAFVIQAWAQQFIPSTHTALIFLLEPVFAWLTSYLLLRERLGVQAGMGAVMILGGILLSELNGSPEFSAVES